MTIIQAEAFSFVHSVYPFTVTDDLYTHLFYVSCGKWCLLSVANKTLWSFSLRIRSRPCRLEFRVCISRAFLLCPFHSSAAHRSNAYQNNRNDRVTLESPTVVSKFEGIFVRSQFSPSVAQTLEPFSTVKPAKQMHRRRCDSLFRRSTQSSVSCRDSVKCCMVLLCS